MAQKGPSQAAASYHDTTVPMPPTRTLTRTDAHILCRLPTHQACIRVAFLCFAIAQSLSFDHATPRPPEAACVHIPTYVCHAHPGTHVNWLGSTPLCTTLLTPRVLLLLRPALKPILPAWSYTVGRRKGHALMPHILFMRRAKRPSLSPLSHLAYGNTPWHTYMPAKPRIQAPSRKKKIESSDAVAQAHAYYYL